MGSHRPLSGRHNGDSSVLTDFGDKLPVLDCPSAAVARRPRFRSPNLARFAARVSSCSCGSDSKEHWRRGKSDRHLDWGRACGADALQCGDGTGRSGANTPLIYPHALRLISALLSSTEYTALVAVHYFSFLSVAG